MVDAREGRGDGGWKEIEMRWWMEGRVEKMVDGRKSRGDGG